MVNYVDIGIIAICLLFAVIGFFRGFIKSAFSFLGTIAALAGGFFGAQALAGKVGQIGGLEEWLSGIVSGWFSSPLFTTSFEISDAAATAEALTAIGMPSFLSSPAASLLLAIFPNGSGTLTLVGVLAPLITRIAISVVLFVILFIVIRLIFSLLSRLTKKIVRNKIVRFIDRILGLALGLAKAYLLLCILLTIVTYVCGMEFAAPVANLLASSSLARTFSDINFIPMLLDGVIAFPAIPWTVEPFIALS